MAAVAAIERFSVEIRGFQLTTSRERAGKDVYFSIDFDGGFYSKDSAPIKLDGAGQGRFDEDLHFIYRTSRVNSLNRKRMIFRVIEKSGMFSLDSSVGHVAIDLLTLASGPRYHELELRDGTAVGGTIRFELRMTHTSKTAFELRGVSVEAATDESGLTLDYGVTLENRLTSKRAPTAARQTHASLEALTADTTYAALQRGSLVFVLRGAGGGFGGAEIARGQTRLMPRACFEDGDSLPFSMPLTGRCAGRVHGTVVFRSLPAFVQMTGGVHTSTGIVRGVLAAPNVKHRPECRMQLAGPAAGGGGGSMYPAPGGFAPPPPGGFAPPPAAVPPRGFASPPPGYGVPRPGAGAGAVAPPPAPLAAAGLGLLRGAYGVPPPAAHAPPPAVSRPVDPAARFFPGAPPLPPVWSVMPPGPGGYKPRFRNNMTGELHGSLPAESNYEVTFPLGGKLGIDFAQRGEGALVGSIDPMSQAAGVGVPIELIPPLTQLTVGHEVVAVNGRDMARAPFAAKIQAMRAAGRPLRLTFRNPFGVPPAVALAYDTRRFVSAAPPAGGGAAPARGGGDGGIYAGPFGSDPSAHGWERQEAGRVGGQMTYVYMHSATQTYSRTWPPTPW